MASSYFSQDSTNRGNTFEDNYMEDSPGYREYLQGRDPREMGYSGDMQMEKERNHGDYDPPNVEIKKSIYLIEEENYVKVNKVYNGETIQVVIAALNCERYELKNFKIGDMICSGFSIIDDSIKVYKGCTELVEDRDYTIIIPKGMIKSNMYKEFSVLVELTDDVDPEERITLVFNAVTRVAAGKNEMSNIGAAIFRRIGLSKSEIIMTERVCLWVCSPQIGVKKTGMPSVVEVGEHIEYTLLVNNSGNYPLSNVILSDEALEEYLSKGSLAFDQENPIKIDGEDAGNQLPVNIGDLMPFTSKIITIEALVKAAPDADYFVNKSMVTADPIDLQRPCVDSEYNKKMPTAESNEVFIECLNAKVDISKTADKIEVEDQEEIEYTLTVTNKSNRLLENVTVFDSLPEETKFIPGSVKVDGETVEDANIRKGINIGDLGRENSTTEPPFTKVVTYRVRVDLGETLTLAEALENLAYATFEYKPTPESGKKKGTTKYVTAVVNVANPSLITDKSPDGVYVVTGDTIDYVISLTNDGDRDFNRITVTDDLPQGLSQLVDVQTTNLDGTVIYDNFSDVYLNAGLQVVGPAASKSSLEVGEGMLVKFSATVESIPASKEFSNTANVCFYYKVTTKTGTEQRSKCQDTNTVTAYGVAESLSVVKSVDPSRVEQGDNAVYTLTIKNTGAAVIKDVILTDPLNSALSLIWDYTLVDGVKVNEKITDAAGVTVPEVQPGQTILVQFAVQYVTVPPTQVDNITNYDYSYIKDPNQDPIVVANNKTNQVTLYAEVPVGSMSILKSSSDKTVLASGTVTYSLKLTNTGTKELMNIVLTDSIPTGMTFIPGTVTVNGTSVTGDISTGISLGITLKANESVYVTFQTKVTASPAPASFDNSAAATFTYLVGSTTVSGSANSNNYIIDLAEIDLVRTQSQSTAAVGDQITHTLIVTNTGNTALGNLNLADIVDPRLTVNPDSITVNGVHTTDSLSNVLLPDLLPNEMAVVTYTGTVNSIGDNSPLVNTATVNGNTIDIKTVADTATISTALVQSSNPNLFNIKLVSAATACIGDILNYQIILYNAGDFGFSNIILQDTLNSCLQLMPNSLTINGTQTTGSLQSLAIPDLAVGSSAVVVAFNAKVVCTTADNTIANFATITYTASNGTTATVQTNVVQTTIINGCQCFCLPVQLYIPGSSSCITEIVGADAQVTGVVPTTNQWGTALEISYSLQITYKDNWYQAQTYTTSAKVNVQLLSSYNDNKLILTFEDMNIMGPNMVSGTLFIRVC